MNRACNLNHKLPAFILLVSLFLQSCYNFTTSPSSTSLKLKEGNRQELTLSIPINQLVDQEFMAEDGHLVTFYQEEGILRANVEINASVGFSKTYNTLPVYIAPDIDLRQLVHLNKVIQKRIIHVHIPKNGQPLSILLAKNGLLGGMKRKREQLKEESDSGEKTQSQAHIAQTAKHQHLLAAHNFLHEEPIALETFPLELIEMIVANVEFPHILDFRRVNKFFYNLITGYNAPGIVGIENKPNPDAKFYSYTWVKGQMTDFEKPKYSALTCHNIPSFLFYRFMGKAISLPAYLWPAIEHTKINTLDLANNGLNDDDVKKLALYLQSTNITSLDLSSNNIEATGAAQLVQHLHGTNVQILGLHRNYLGPTGVTQLAPYLLGTNIRTLVLSKNQITSEGVAQLAQCLPDTKIQTLILTKNQITSEGVVQLAQHLPKTNIHTLILSQNQITAEGIAQLAECLPDTKIHTLILNKNQLQAEGAVRLLQHLEDTNMQMLNLSHNKIEYQETIDESIKCLLPCQSLHTLCLGWNNMGDQVTIFLASYLKSIESLNLAYNNIGSEGVTQLAQHLAGTKVHTLVLEGNEINAKAIGQFVKCLAHTAIHTLFLGHNDIQDEGVGQLALYLKETGIEKLSLAHNNIGPKGINQLAQHLSGTKIHTLALEGNEIGSKGVAQLTKDLIQTQIHTLDLSTNNIRTEGITHLVKHLPGTTIHTLFLGYNDIENEGALQLAQCLEKTNIQMLDLSGNNIAAKTQHSLKEAYPLILWKF